jgi:multidrug efflux pump subunit AcrB
MRFAQLRRARRPILNDGCLGKKGNKFGTMVLLSEPFGINQSMQRFIGTIINHHVLANLVMIIILLTGAMAGFSMLRESFPEIEPALITVSVIYPGADVEEIEEGIARKIEEAVDGLEGVKRYTTVSSENVGQALIEIIDGFPMEKARDLIENAVDSISTFPGAAEKPIITEAQFRREMLNITLWGDMDESTRKETAEEIKDELQAHPDISQVRISGVRDYEITIEISEEKLRKYGLTFSEITQAIQKGSVNLSGGSFLTQREKISIRVKDRKYFGRELSELVVLTRSTGELITLDQVANVRDAFTEDPVIARFNGKPAVMITLLKTPDEDAISIARAGHEYVKRKAASLPEGIQLTAWADGSLVIDDRLSITFRNGLLGLSLVLLCLWTFLNTRLSFWVAMGIPISMSGSLIVLWLAGLTLNSVTLFGMVMVLGIIVDDAIIIGEAIFLHRTQGDGPLMAAVNGVREVGLPVIAAVATTILAFMPLGFISGVMGQFMGTMAIAVIGALLVSLIEALFILPAHLAHLPSAEKTKMNTNSIKSVGRRVRGKINGTLDFIIHTLYGRAIRRLIHYRYIVLASGISFVLMTVGLASGGFIKFAPFPSWDDNQILATIEFPQGTSTEITQKALLKMEDGLNRYIESVEDEHGEKLIEEVFTITGQGSGSQGSPSGNGTHFGTIKIQLQHSNNRSLHSQDILAGWSKEVGVIDGALSQSFASQENGPGGAPIEIWIQGRDTENLRAVAEEIRTKLQSYDGLYQIEDSFRPGKRELKVLVKPEARTMGITQEDLARQVYAGFYGLEADRIQRGRDDIRIKVRYSNDERSSLGNLQNIRIRTPEGHEVPFHAVAFSEFGAGPASIDRTDGQRRIKVTAQLDENRANAAEILGDIEANFFPELYDRYSGFTLALEGDSQDSMESIDSLLRLFPIAMVGIFIIIATLFRSYMQPMVVILAIPFGLIGAVLGHVILGWQLVMFSVFGMMALTGVVVNDAIVLIEAINTQIAKGTPVLEAIAQGGIRRFRAIMLTSLSTIGALIPVIIEDDLSSQPLNPMALSLACGVGFATVLTLVFIPSMIAILNDFRRVFHMLLKGAWPTREDVEPARLRHIDIFAED